LEIVVCSGLSKDDSGLRIRSNQLNCSISARPFIRGVVFPDAVPWWLAGRWLRNDQRSRTLGSFHSGEHCILTQAHDTHVVLTNAPHLVRRIQGDLSRKTSRGYRLSDSPLVASTPGPVCTPPLRVQEILVSQRSCLLDRSFHVPILTALKLALRLAGLCVGVCSEASYIRALAL
jgi:hypothetical protein